MTKLRQIKIKLLEDVWIGRGLQVYKNSECTMQLHTDKVNKELHEDYTTRQVSWKSKLTLKSPKWDCLNIHHSFFDIAMTLKLRESGFFWIMLWMALAASCSKKYVLIKNNYFPTELWPLNIVSLHRGKTQKQNHLTTILSWNIFSL